MVPHPHYCIKHKRGALEWHFWGTNLSKNTVYVFVINIFHIIAYNVIECPNIVQILKHHCDKAIHYIINDSWFLVAQSVSWTKSTSSGAINTRIHKVNETKYKNNQIFLKIHHPGILLLGWHLWACDGWEKAIGQNQ